MIIIIYISLRPGTDNVRRYNALQRISIKIIAKIIFVFTNFIICIRNALYTFVSTFVTNYNLESVTSWHRSFFVDEPINETFK